MFGFRCGIRDLEDRALLSWNHRQFALMIENSEECLEVAWDANGIFLRRFMHKQNVMF